MSPLDSNLIDRKKKLILADIVELEKLALMTEDEYVNNYDVQLQAERLLEKSIGRIIDINYHILKQSHQLVPDSYFESFVKMGKVGEVGQEVAQRLAACAGLRNVLAHDYDVIDPHKIYAVLKNNLTDMMLYLQAIKN